MKTNSQKVKDFLNGHSGQRLLSMHKLSDRGMWQIYGEDPNCDFGGSHIEPKLALVEGVLEDVIRYAVELPRWYNWGSGGSIERIPEATKITADSWSEVIEKQEKRKLLEAELERLKNELNEL